MGARTLSIGFAVLLACLVAACAPLIAGYSLQAYQNATTLKADVAAMADNSTDDYATHASDVSALTLRLNEAYQFAKGEPENAIAARQWQILLDPDGHLYGGFVAKWRHDGHLSQAEAGNVHALLDRAFDQIICLEANKQTATACAAPEPLPGAGS
jgi:hypothetical protein